MVINKIGISRSPSSASIITLEVTPASEHGEWKDKAELRDYTPQTILGKHLITEKIQSNCSTDGIAYLEMAASSGDRSAYSLLGRAYEEGFSVRRSMSRALYYYAIAAAYGDKTSECRWRWLMALEGILWSRARIV